MTTMNNSDPLLGRVVDGRYLIQRKLARGGMATVYLATDQRLTRTVAVKVMHDNLGDDREFVDRFDREARAAARLSHPNVVAVFDQGMDDGRPYIVMEYVQGSTLRHVITREAPMSPSRALDLLIPVTAAVAAAHEAGIIHRDLKPENVLISNRGQLKVADFGLARAVTAHTATADGMLIGTVSYIAPELVTHDKADARCDVYALGVVLFEMLTGRKPHTGDTPIQVAYSHVHNEIEPPSAHAPQQWRGTANAVPSYLDALVLAAAARRPEDRPADARVLLNHLRTARQALNQPQVDEAALVAQMRQTGLVDADQLTEPVPSLVAPTGEVHPTAMLRFTPATPMSPNHPGAADGMPYYDDGSAPLASPAAVGVQQRQRRRRRRTLTVLIGLLLASLVLAIGGWYYLAGRYTTTPDLTNLTQAEAQTSARKHDLSLQFEQKYSETVASGQVIETDPAAGQRVLIGGQVTAYLSKGPERYPVPSLVGRTADDAEAALKEVHLVVGEIKEVYDDTATVGTVVSASIEAGKQVKRDTSVDLNISKGPAPVKIVSYVNKLYTAAKSHYETAGLTVTMAEERNDDKIAAGKVISQDPDSGTVAKGGSISFVVSKGPVMVDVPYVRYLSVDAATTKMKAAGFKVKVTYQSRLLNLVAYSNPNNGTQAPKGSTITLIVV